MTTTTKTGKPADDNCLCCEAPIQRDRSPVVPLWHRDDEAFKEAAADHNAGCRWVEKVESSSIAVS